MDAYDDYIDEEAAKREAEEDARAAAEATKLAAQEKARKKAARAPDKEKIRAICTQLNITLPDVATPEARELLIEISSRIGSLAKFISDAAEAL